VSGSAVDRDVLRLVVFHAHASWHGNTKTSQRNAGTLRVGSPPGSLIPDPRSRVERFHRKHARLPRIDDDR
jgi:hypothetical protein